MHLRGREGRLLGIKGERNRRSTVGKPELLGKEGGAPNSYFSPKRKTNAALHLMEMCICTPGRKMLPVNLSMVRRVISAHKSLCFFKVARCPTKGSKGLQSGGGKTVPGQYRPWWV